jgi:5'-3' exonuclease
MVNVNLGNPEEGVRYITPGTVDSVNGNEIVLNTNFGLMDQSVTVEGLRTIYSRMKNEVLPLYMPEGISFHGKLNGFTKAIVDSEDIFNIHTTNIELLNSINKNIAERIPVTSVLVVDTHNFYHRNFHALPRMYDQSGRPTSLLKALSGLLKWIGSSDYSHVVFASEGKNSLRVKYTTEKLGEENAYKANRSETDPELKEQIQMCDNFLESIGFKVLSMEGYEADDIIASVTHEFSTRFNVPVHAFTGDKDLCQLYEYPNYKIVDVKNKQLLGEDYLIEKFSVSSGDFSFTIDSSNFIDFQSIIGDTSDNVIGINGIGKVGAAKLLNQFGSLDNILANVENIEQKGMKTKLEEGGVESALLSRDLVYMRRHLLSDSDLSVFARKFYDFEYLAKTKLSAFDINY